MSKGLRPQQVDAWRDSFETMRQWLSLLPEYDPEEDAEQEALRLHQAREDHWKTLTDAVESRATTLTSLGITHADKETVAYDLLWIARAPLIERFGRDDETTPPAWGYTPVLDFVPDEWKEEA